MLELPPQIAVLPEIEPGVAGADPPGDTARETVADEPHELLALTVILPAKTPAVVFIELEVELPVQPEGRIQV